MAKEMNRLHKLYLDVVVPAIMKEKGFKNINEVPRIEKIIVSRGLGDVKDNSQAFNKAVDELGAITGQKPVTTIAKKSIANFKLREGAAIGCKVTLRAGKMYAFLDKLVSISLPRVRDFRGVNKNAFDGRGNYTLGVKEQLIFPEIDYDKVGKIRGMDIVIVTTANTDEEAYELLKLLGMPFQR